MASSFPLGIATRATTQRNNADSVGATIGNPVEIIDCSSDLDSVASDSPYIQPVPLNVVIKLEPGTTTVSAQEVNEGKEPHNMSDKELTAYLDDPEPPPTCVEHASEGEPLSAIGEPPIAGGNIPALKCNPITTSYASTSVLNQVPLTISISG